MALMLQYVAFQINSVPYGVKYINSYSNTQIQKLRQDPELITFLRPADWIMFSAPKGLDFKSLQTSLGSPVKDAVDKLNILKDFRNDELISIINKQYNNVCLESSNILSINSVVLLRNISNESKREPPKLARVYKIKKSRDGSQRVVTVTYHNTYVNRKGEWVGTPVEVERCV